MKTFNNRRDGVSLVETIIGVAVMALVITGGLVAVGQATLLSEKSSKQVEADFILRQEVETLRAIDWSDVEALEAAIASYKSSNPAKDFPDLQTFDSLDLAVLGFEASVKADSLESSGERGKTIFKMNLKWSDKSGKEFEEARVIVISEGGFSAST